MNRQSYIFLVLLGIFSYTDAKASESPFAEIPAAFNDFDLTHFISIHQKYHKEYPKYFPSPSAEEIGILNIEDLKVCKDHGLNIEVIVMVKSAAENFMARQDIRNTWGKDAQQLRSKVAFVLGEHKDDDVKHKIKLESKEHGDVLQGTFVDSHHNLTLKSFVAYKWVLEHCSKASYLIKCDDDVYINFARLMPKVGHLQSKSVAGYSFEQQKISRDFTKENYFVPETVYPFRTLPNYLIGCIILMPMDSAKAIYEASKSVPYFIFDDVYETGILNSISGIQIYDAKTMFAHGGTAAEKCDGCAYPASTPEDDWDACRTSAVMQISKNTLATFYMYEISRCESSASSAFGHLDIAGL